MLKGKINIKGCQYIFPKGKRLGTVCGKKCIGKLCYSHSEKKRSYLKKYYENTKENEMGKKITEKMEIIKNAQRKKDLPLNSDEMDKFNKIRSKIITINKKMNGVKEYLGTITNEDYVREKEFTRGKCICIEKKDIPENKEDDYQECHVNCGNYFNIKYNKCNYCSAPLAYSSSKKYIKNRDIKKNSVEYMEFLNKKHLKYTNKLKYQRLVIIELDKKILQLP